MLAAFAFNWCLACYWQSLDGQLRLYLGVVGVKVFLYILTVCVLSYAAPWVLAVDPLVLLTSGNFADSCFGLTFIFAPETLVVQGVYSFAGRKLWGVYTWFFTAVIAISDAIGVSACLIICSNWQRGDLIEAPGSGPLPMLLVTLYFCSSWIFALLLIVAKLHSGDRTQQGQRFAEVCSMCDSVGSVAASAVMAALVIVVTVSLLLEGMGYSFCPTCATVPLEDLAPRHRYAERCNVLESWRPSVGREWCSFSCTEGYEGQAALLPCFGGVRGNATDIPQCAKTTTSTTTTQTTTTSTTSTTITHTTTATTTTTTADPHLGEETAMFVVWFVLIFLGVAYVCIPWWVPYVCGTR